MRRLNGYRATALAAGLCLASLVPLPAFAATSVWTRTGNDRAAAEADLAACQNAAGYVPARPSDTGGATVSGALLFGVAGAAAGYMVEAARANAWDSDHRPESADRCMRRHGYVRVSLTGAEQTALDALTTPSARSSWMNAFYASDLTGRIAGLREAALPWLPEAKAEPDVFAGVRFDEEKLTRTGAIVVEGHPMLVGPVTHRRTARLHGALDVDAGMKVHADAGTVMHQVVAPGHSALQQTYWCGQMHMTGGILRGGSRVGPVCIANGDETYELGAGDGPAWLNRTPDPAATPVIIRDSPIALDESDQDLIGPMDFALRVMQVDADAALLEARAYRGGQTVWFWQFHLPFDKNGKAVLPFWGHRLTLTQGHMVVKVDYTPDGDGSDWNAAVPAP